MMPDRLNKCNVNRWRRDFLARFNVFHDDIPGKSEAARCSRDALEIAECEELAGALREIES